MLNIFQLGLLIDNVQNKKNNKKTTFVKPNDIESVHTKLFLSGLEIIIVNQI